MTQAGFLTLLLFLSLLSVAFSPRPGSAVKSFCFKVNNCQCIMKDGSGLINLEAIGDTGGFLEYLKLVSAEDADDEILLLFSPCRPLSPPEDISGNECTNIAASIIIRYHKLNTYLSRCISYGSHEENEFHYNDSLKVLTVSYFAGEERPLAVAHYHCSPDQSSSVIRDLRLSGDGGPLEIWVESPCACPNACFSGDLGSGTILLIILSLIAAAYFILGSCALRPFRSSSGVQIVPEQSVWCVIFTVCTERRPRRRCYTNTSRCEQ